MKKAFSHMRDGHILLLGSGNGKDKDDRNRELEAKVTFALSFLSN